jgi:hypothetical protein
MIAVASKPHLSNEAVCPVAVVFENGLGAFGVVRQEAFVYFTAFSIVSSAAMSLAAASLIDRV